MAFLPINDSLQRPGIEPVEEKYRLEGEGSHVLGCKAQLVNMHTKTLSGSQHLFYKFIHKQMLND